MIKNKQITCLLFSIILIYYIMNCDIVITSAHPKHSENFSYHLKKVTCKCKFSAINYDK